MGDAPAVPWRPALAEPANVGAATRAGAAGLSPGRAADVRCGAGSGHAGNEVAEDLAEKGAEMTLRGPCTTIPLADAVTTLEIKELGNRMHQRYWDSHPHFRQTKMMLPKAKNKLWKQLIKQPRKMMNLITQIYTGHATLKRHLNLMAIEEDGRCNQCNEENTEETVQHYLAECPAF